MGKCPHRCTHAVTAIANRAQNPDEYIEVSDSGQETEEESGKTAYRTRYQQLTMTTRN